MKTKIRIAAIGNLIDAFATYILYTKFGFTELNLAMAFLLQWPILFLIVKLALGFGILYYLSKQEYNKYVEIAATTAAVLYGAIGLYYIIWFIIILL